MFKEGGHIMLNLLELVELEVRVDDGEDVPSFGLFVNEDAVTVAHELFFHAQEAFAFEHDGQDITCGNIVRVVKFDKFAQERFGGFFLDGLGLRDRSFIHPLPIRDETLPVTATIAVLLLPAGLADVEAMEIGAFIEEQRMVGLFIGERFAAGGAGVGARLNIPLGHDWAERFRFTRVLLPARRGLQPQLSKRPDSILLLRGLEVNPHRRIRGWASRI